MMIDVYLHASKEACIDAGQEAGLTEKALHYFMYAGTEHKATYEVDPATGNAKLVAIDGRKLQ